MLRELFYNIIQFFTRRNVVHNNPEIRIQQTFQFPEKPQEKEEQPADLLNLHIIEYGTDNLNELPPGLQGGPSNTPIFSDYDLAKIMDRYYEHQRTGDDVHFYVRDDEIDDDE
jgi:hypothetical protein